MAPVPLHPDRPHTSGTPDTPPVQQHVLVGYDGSDLAEAALHHAVEEAVVRHAALEILCGRPWGKHPAVPAAGAGGRDAHSDISEQALHEQSRRVLEQAAERVRCRAPGLRVIPTMTGEPAADALVQRGQDAALTVIGTRGHGGFAGLLLGSVSLRVASHTTSPLMVVRGDTSRTHGTVVVGLESERDTDVLRFGFEQAQRHSAKLRALHAWQYTTGPGDQPHCPPHLGDSLDEQARNAESVPRYAVAPWREKFPDVLVHADAVCLPPARALVEASGTADAVVLAVHRRPRRLGLRLGPVTHAVLHHARCPVLLIPTD